MIIIKLQGGLGNQMFQFALASITAKKNKTILKIDFRFFDLKKKVEGFTPRNFELSIFNNSYTKASLLEIKKFDKNLSYFNAIKKRMGLHYPKVYKEPTFKFQQKALEIKSPVYIDGYFQSYKYFLSYENFVRSLFLFPVNKLDSKNKKLYDFIQDNTCVSIHIRRGDYVNDKTTQNFHGICSKEYYLNAINFINKEVKSSKFIFFSDDIEWVKKEFKNFPFPKIFTEGNEKENAWKDMFLMSSCSHQIIANSSFSWWSAWLNKNTGKIVIAPKKWFVDDKTNSNTMDLIPNAWVRL